MGKALHGLIEEHYARTGSQRARAMLDNWDDALPLFWQVCPKEMLARLEYGLEEPPPLAAEAV